MSRLRIAAVIVLLSTSLALHAENWSRWRGPHNNGMATSNAPLNWSATENIKWVADIPAAERTCFTLLAKKINDSGRTDLPVRQRSVRTTVNQRPARLGHFANLLQWLWVQRDA